MKNKLVVKVLGALALAFVAGLYLPEGSFAVRFAELLGQLFLNALALVVIPLVVSSMILGAARMGAEGKGNILGLRLFGSIVLMTSLSVSFGFLMMHLFGSALPSIADSQMMEEIVSLPSDKDRFGQFAEIALKVVPGNLVAVASEGQILGLVLFCLGFGYFSGRIATAQTVVQFWHGMFDVMMSLTLLVMRALPIGVFGIFTKVISVSGYQALKPLSAYFLLVLASLVLFGALVIPLLLRVNPFLFIRSLAAPLVTAFSTSSSAATLPIAIQSVEEKLGVPKEVVGMTLPVGASMSFCGSAMNTCMATLFITHLYGIPITFEVGSLILVMSILTSFGMGGIPSAAIFSQMIVLQTVGLPAEGVGLVIAVDRFLDMVRTPVNVLGNISCTLLATSSAPQESPVPSTAP